MNQEFWNTKYEGQEFHYGEAPNRFLELMLESRPPGRLLFPAEGEGRNAVYAARLGWEVHAFDISEKGRAKALALAKEKGVEINYNLNDALAFQSNLKFDAIALIYAHFPSEIRAAVHHKMAALLKPVGELWLEAFAPGQLSFNSGGPKDESMLYSPELLAADFSDLQIRQNKVMRYKLAEGPGHEGMAEVIRLRGVKM